MSLVLIGGGIVIILVVVVAYFMGYFDSDDDSDDDSDVDSDDESASSSTLIQSSLPAAHGGYDIHENQFLTNGKDPIWSPVWGLGKSVTIENCKDNCDKESGCDGFNLRVKDDDPTDLMCWVLNPSDEKTILVTTNQEPGYLKRSYTKKNAIIGE